MGPYMIQFGLDLTLIWLRVADILRCFELQMWGKGVLKHAPACLLKSCMSLLIYLQIYIGAQHMCDTMCMKINTLISMIVDVVMVEYHGGH